MEISIYRSRLKIIILVNFILSILFKKLCITLVYDNIGNLQNHFVSNLKIEFRKCGASTKSIQFMRWSWCTTLHVLYEFLNSIINRNIPEHKKSKSEIIKLLISFIDSNGRYLRSISFIQFPI